MEKDRLLFKVKLHCEGSEYYIIEYKTLFKRFWSFLNYFVPWFTLYCTYHGGSKSYKPDRFHPVMTSFEEAVSISKKFKENPKLLLDHIKTEDEKYKRLMKEYNDYLIETNKTVII